MMGSAKKLSEFFEFFDASREYFRFDMVVPKEMFAKGRNFPIYNPDWQFDCTWEDDDTIFPVGDVTGIMLVGRFDGNMRIAIIIESHNINKFLRNFNRVVDEHDFEFEILPPMVIDEVI